MIAGNYFYTVDCIVFTVILVNWYILKHILFWKTITNEMSSIIYFRNFFEGSYNWDASFIFAWMLDYTILAFVPTSKSYFVALKSSFWFIGLLSWSSIKLKLLFEMRKKRWVSFLIEFSRFHPNNLVDVRYCNMFLLKFLCAIRMFVFHSFPFQLYLIGQF